VLIRMHYSFPPEVRLAVISLHMFQNWREIVGQPCDVHKTGFVRIVHPQETDRLQRNVDMQRSLGAQVELVDRTQLRELEPDWKVDELELAAYEPDSGYGDGAAVTRDFLGAARDLGVHYLSRTQATGFMVEAGRVRGVTANHGAITAPVVISATGPWTRPLFAAVGCDLPIECVFHQVAILRNAAGMRGGRSACIDSVSATYFRSDAHDKFLVGDFYGKCPVDPDDFPQRAPEESLEEIIERACRRTPKLAGAEVMRGVTGVYDMTPDSRPLFGEIPGIAGLHYARIFREWGSRFLRRLGWS
jgi:glycine/D-amino acid oxidase-like deaminating enzyme